MQMMKDVANIDEYISMFPAKTQKILKKIRTIISKTAPEAEEAMRYGLPTFRLNGNLLHFGAFEHHIGFYPTPAVIEAFKREVSKYNWSKGTVQFALNEPIPYDLVTEMSKFRVAQVLEEKMQKAKSKKK